ncbi:unnamed protein product [Phytomonas sp. Hart1]|nr:unnamed protein product [Phytomonas sp. Hart1]|eukprot:CCW67833.1 unnamed protein product [Phytomonas sp. isolate Hart1]
MRIRCLSWALDACKMFYPQDLILTIRTTVGEVILFSFELAMDILEKIQSIWWGPVNTLLHLVIAGLTGKSSAMV